MPILIASTLPFLGWTKRTMIDQCCVAILDLEVVSRRPVSYQMINFLCKFTALNHFDGFRFLFRINCLSITTEHLEVLVPPSLSLSKESEPDQSPSRRTIKRLN